MLRSKSIAVKFRHAGPGFHGPPSRESSGPKCVRKPLSRPPNGSLPGCLHYRGRFVLVSQGRIMALTRQEATCEQGAKKVMAGADYGMLAQRVQPPAILLAPG